jgi:hypothetical protein
MIQDIRTFHAIPHYVTNEPTVHNAGALRQPLVSK